MSRLLRVLVPVLIAIAVAAASTAHATTRGAATTPAFRLVTVAGPTFTAPVWIGSAPGSSTALYVVEQRGIVWKLVGTTRTRFLDLRNVIGDEGGEQGLLALAFARDYVTSGRVFAYFTLPNGNGQVRQYRARAGRIIAGSGRVIISVKLTSPPETNHNGGNLVTGPRGLLYLSIGDGGGGGDPLNNAQNLSRLAGKLIRIVPKLDGGYIIPRTNPYYTRAGARKEIYALGLRNPWRFSIDAPTGDIWIGDVGQSSREEIDRLPNGAPAGANFGWRRTEGNTTYAAGTRLTAGTPYVRPFLDYGRANGECSVTGGVVYRGPVTALRGWYLYTDYCTDTVRAVLPATRAAASGTGASGIVGFGAASNGHVYAVSQQTGRVYRIAAA